MLIFILQLYDFLDCPLNVPMTPLKVPATCLIPSHCTGVDCCVDIDLLGRSLHAYVDLDTCNNQFTVGIEKLKLDPVSLIDYKFGRCISVYCIFLFSWVPKFVDSVKHAFSWILDLEVFSKSSYDYIQMYNKFVISWNFKFFVHLLQRNPQKNTKFTENSCWTVLP